METKICPRCGHEMTYNIILKDYICDECHYISPDTREKAEKYASAYCCLTERAVGKQQSVQRMMDIVNDRF